MEGRLRVLVLLHRERKPDVLLRDPEEVDDEAVERAVVVLVLKVQGTQTP